MNNPNIILVTNLINSDIWVPLVILTDCSGHKITIGSICIPSMSHCWNEYNVS